jgi:hypothetical protein
MNRLTDPGLAPVTTWLARGLVHGAFASALILVGAAPAPAQSTATLQGTVTDAQNAAIPGATVVVRNTATGGTRTITTDRTGNYVAASLPPGPYRVDVKLEGFGSQGREVTLEVGTTAQLDVQLALGGVTEQVSVTGGSPILDTRTTSVSTVINQRTVQEIPLNGRHFVDLGLLIPGSVTPPQSGFLTAPLRGQGSFAFNTAGNREDTVNFMINGVNLNDMVQNQITFQPSINTVQEFKVDNSTFSAEYGRNSGAIVNIATRSGANAFHGEGFEFLRNHRFDSRNRFNAPPARQSPFKRNQYGASLGGPIVRDHAFLLELRRVAPAPGHRHQQRGAQRHSTQRGGRSDFAPAPGVHSVRQCGGAERRRPVPRIGDGPGRHRSGDRRLQPGAYPERYRPRLLRVSARSAW